MKGTEHFKQTIKAYLDNRAAEDELFTQSYAKLYKNLDDCITYVLNWVKASGCAGFSDDEIFSQCVHYYDEDNIEVGKSVNCQVAVNHVVELTEEEKQEARKMALARYQEAELQKLQNRNKAKVKIQVTTNSQPSLFDF